MKRTVVRKMKNQIKKENGLISGDVTSLKGGENISTEIKRTKAVWELDATKYNKSLQGINKQMQVAKSEFKLADSNMKKLGQTTNTLAQKKQALQKQIDLNNKKIDLYSKSLEKSNTKVNEAVKRRKELEKNLKDTEDAYKKVVAEQGKESKEAQELKEKLDKLKKEYSDNAKEIDNNTKKSANYQQAINKSKVELNNLETELKKVSKELTTSTNKIAKAQEKLNTFGERSKKLGGNMSKLGNGVLTATAPFIGLGAAAAKVSVDFESAMSNVQAISGATGDDFNTLREKAKEMGAATSKSATDSADAMSYMALAGWNTKQILTGIEPILRLSEAGNMDLALASDLVTDSMSAMGVQVNDLASYLDVCAQAQRKSNTSAQQMLEAYVGVGGMLKGLKMPIEESATWLGILANRGIKGSEAGNKFSSVLTNLTTGAGQAGKAMEKLKVSAFDNKGNFKGLKKTLEELDVALSKCTEEQKNQYLAMIGGKTQVDTLNALLSGSKEEYADLKASIEGSNGALNEMASTMQNNTKGNITRLKSQLEGLGIQLGEHILPHINDMIGAISKAVTWFSNLDSGTQKTIVNMIGLSAATGVGLKVFGGLFTAVGSVSKGLSKGIGIIGKFTNGVSKMGTATKVAAGTKGLGSLGKAAGSIVGKNGGIGLLTKGLKLVTKAFTPMGIAITGGTLAIGLLGKKLGEEVVPKVDLFEDSMNRASDGTLKSVTKISDATKKAVGAYMELDKNATASLSNLYYNSTAITTDTANNLKAQYNEMGKSITTELDKDYKNNLTVMQNFLNSSSVLNEQEKAQYLETLKSKYANEKEETIKAQEEIKAILNTASQEKRALKESEWQRITELQNMMRTNAVECMTQQEEETNIILGRMASYNGRVTAEMAGEHVRQLEDARIKSVDQANKEYNERIRVAEQMRTSGVKNASELANGMIKEAERMRKETIDKANKIKEDGIDKLSRSYSNLRDEIDTNTGEVLSIWGRLKKWWEGWIPSRKEFPMRQATVSDFKGVNQGTSSSKQSSRQITRNYDKSAFSPSTVFNNVDRRVRENIVQQTFDYARLEKMVNSIENTIKMAFDNKQGIYIDGDKLVGETINKTDRELARHQLISEYGFR